MRVSTNGVPTARFNNSPAIKLWRDYFRFWCVFEPEPIETPNKNGHKKRPNSTRRGNKPKSSKQPDKNTNVSRGVLFL